MSDQSLSQRSPDARNESIWARASGRGPHWLRDHRLIARWVLVGSCVLFTLSALFPLIFMIQAAFRTERSWANSQFALPTNPTLDSLRRLWAGGVVLGYLWHSAVITVGTVSLSVVLAVLAGYSFAKINWRMRRPVYLFVLAWIALPPVILIVPIYIQMVDLHLIDSFWSLILLYSAFNLPFNTYLMTSFFQSLPDELIEASKVDGCGTNQTFLRVMVPLAKPALGTLVIFNALYAWNEFVFALLLLTNDSVKPLTVGVQQLQGRYTTDKPTIMMGLLIASIPIIAVYVFFQKYLTRGIVLGAVK